MYKKEYCLHPDIQQLSLADLRALTSPHKGTYIYIQVFNIIKCGTAWFDWKTC